MLQYQNVMINKTKKQNKKTISQYLGCEANASVNKQYFHDEIQRCLFSTITVS